MMILRRIEAASDINNPNEQVTVSANPINNSCTTSSLSGYTITEVPPAGYLDGKDTAGSLGGTAGKEFIKSIVVNTNSNGVNYNFGELKPGNLSGYCYVDNNNDGCRETGEAGICGVTVTLTGTDDHGGSVNIVCTTGSDGSYHFGNLRPGTHSICEISPTSSVHGRDHIGSQGGTDCNNQFSAIIVSCGICGVENDFAERLCGYTQNGGGDSNGNSRKNCSNSTDYGSGD